MLVLKRLLVLLVLQLYLRRLYVLSFQQTASDRVQRDASLIGCSRTGATSLRSTTGDSTNLCNDGYQPQQEQQHPTGIYIHIPFCRRRCRYCNFAVVPIGLAGSSSASNSFQKLNDMYTNALLQEIRFVCSQQNHMRPGKIMLQSIYFGGGTPSLAPVETLQQILGAILDEDNSPFAIKENCEITIEIDPGTFDIDKLRAVRAMGFNRISLGVQSFDDNILKSLGRVHTSRDVWESLRMLGEVFGSNVNYSMDLISGLPGLSLAKWVETLQTAVHLKPRPLHLSIYDLQIERVSFSLLLQNR